MDLIIIDLHLIIIYLCMKYESNTLMYSKDIARKPFLNVQKVRTRHMDKGDAIKNNGGIINVLNDYSRSV